MPHGWLFYLVCINNWLRRKGKQAFDRSNGLRHLIVPTVSVTASKLIYFRNAKLQLGIKERRAKLELGVPSRTDFTR